jgi:diguanylate cyclase (GGDEF)-like protein
VRAIVPRRALLRLASLWSTTRFRDPALAAYAERVMLDEVRRGVSAMAALSVVLDVFALAFCVKLGYDGAYLYTYAASLVLALHVLVSARFAHGLRDLYVLGITLLVVSSAAFVLLAHRMGSVSGLLLATVVLLFMVIPIVPWGLKHCVAAMTLVYAVFTTSIYGVAERFPAEQLWTMQFLMLAAVATTLTIVARNVQVRRDDMRGRFRLERAHRKVQAASLQDPLTGAWNRRFLDANFRRIVAEFRARQKDVHFALLDIDNFKAANDRFGHHHGDAVLQRFARMFQQRVGNDGYLIRLGGDEFALLYSGTDYGELMQTALAAFAADLADARDPLRSVTASVGSVRIAPAGDVLLDVVYRGADQALYEEKSRLARSHADAELQEMLGRSA